MLASGTGHVTTDFYCFFPVFSSFFQFCPPPFTVYFPRCVFRVVLTPSQVLAACLLSARSTESTHLRGPPPGNTQLPPPTPIPPPIHSILPLKLPLPPSSSLIPIPLNPPTQSSHLKLLILIPGQSPAQLLILIQVNLQLQTKSSSLQIIRTSPNSSVHANSPYKIHQGRAYRNPNRGTMETTNDAQDTPTGEPPMRLKQRLTKRRGDARTARQSTRTDRRESRTARHDNEGRRQAGPTSENTHCETTHRGTTGNGQQSNERWDDRRAIKTAASADHYTSRVQ